MIPSARRINQMNLQQAVSLVDGDVNLLRTVLHLLPEDPTHPDSWNAHVLCRVAKEYQPLHAPWEVVDGVWCGKTHCWLAYTDMFILDVKPKGGMAFLDLRDWHEASVAFTPLALTDEQLQAVETDVERLRQMIFAQTHPAA